MQAEHRRQQAQAQALQSKKKYGTQTSYSTDMYNRPVHTQVTSRRSPRNTLIIPKAENMFSTLTKSKQQAAGMRQIQQADSPAGGADAAGRQSSRRGRCSRQTEQQEGQMQQADSPAGGAGIQSSRRGKYSRQTARKTLQVIGYVHAQQQYPNK